MGMDLITAIAVWPKDTILDFEAGKEAARNLDRGDVPEYVLEGPIGYDLDYDDDGVLTDEGLSELRASMERAVEEMEHIAGSSRNTASFILLGHIVLVFGEATWGDTPEGYDEFVAVGDTPKVASAIGFCGEEVYQ